MEQTALTAAKPVKIPGPDHPIAIERNPARVVVTVGGRIVADTRDALTLREAHYPAVQYIPLRDVVQDRLKPSDTETYCPYKGDASYYHVVTEAGDTVDDAIWTYLQPYPAVGQIAGHVAFYPNRVDKIEQGPA